ncbi:hypothetical protein AVEN_37999-1, partial [Araneus ventricosus]
MRVGYVIKRLVFQTLSDRWFMKSFPTSILQDGFRTGFLGNAFADLSFKPCR